MWMTAEEPLNQTVVEEKNVLIQNLGDEMVCFGLTPQILHLNGQKKEKMV